MKTKANKVTALIAAAAFFCAAGCGDGECITDEEWRLIASGLASAPMRVLTVDNREDSLVLRTPCTNFNTEELEKMFSDKMHRPLIMKLAERMVVTVTDPSQDGVGIAGPQVGISRRIVAVQRFDKPGEPFEVYPNIRIVRRCGEMKTGPEGCLSIPGRRGYVERSDTVVIMYAAPVFCKEPIATMPKDAAARYIPEAWSQEGYEWSYKDGEYICEHIGVWDYVTEKVGGFTAIIFQHECDHLDGILYTDREIPQPQL